MQGLLGNYQRHLEYKYKRKEGFNCLLTFFFTHYSPRSMGLDARSGIAVFEVIFYAPISVIGVLLAIRHGFLQNLAWLFLSSFSLGQLKRSPIANSTSILSVHSSNRWIYFICRCLATRKAQCWPLDSSLCHARTRVVASHASHLWIPWNSVSRVIFLASIYLTKLVESIQSPESHFQ
jgi:hypothetical protein